MLILKYLDDLKLKAFNSVFQKTVLGTMTLRITTLSRTTLGIRVKKWSYASAATALSS
jgi:hypothetical protein